LGAEAAKLSALVQNRKRLGRPMDEEVRLSFVIPTVGRNLLCACAGSKQVPRLRFAKTRNDKIGGA
jgi:hypothetical protein